MPNVFYRGKKFQEFSQIQNNQFVFYGKQYLRQIITIKTFRLTTVCEPRLQYMSMLNNCCRVFLFKLLEKSVNTLNWIGWDCYEEIGFVSCKSFQWSLWGKFCLMLKYHFCSFNNLIAKIWPESIEIAKFTFRLRHAWIIWENKCNRFFAHKSYRLSIMKAHLTQGTTRNMKQVVWSVLDSLDD